MEIKIEKGIPLPEARSNMAGLAHEMRKMKIGDSFAKSVKSYSNFHAYAKYAGIKVTVRKQPNGEWRVWRVA